MLGWRRITNAHNERTVIASLFPRNAVGDSLFLAFPSQIDVETVIGLCANLSSFILDYASRQKMGGTNMNYFVLKQLPVLTPAKYATDAAWHPEVTLRKWILPRVLELTYTAWDLEPFARDTGYDGPPFIWNPGRRFLLRCELDAAFFHLYGLSHDEAAYVMETFPIVRKNDEKIHGEYRTKRVILEIYDEIAKVIRTGGTYTTRLDPPPANPRVAHSPQAKTFAKSMGAVKV
jgi:hypothetical protein